MDMNGAIYDVFAETSAKAAGIHEGSLTYIGDDGLRRCKVCGKKLETILHFNSPALKSMDGMKVNCICLCDKEKIEKMHKEMQMLAKKSDAPIMRAECFKSKAMHDMIFKNDDSPNSEAGSTTRGYVRSFNNNSKWLFIYGTYGTGKSFYAACIANALIDKGYTVRMGTGADFEAEIFGAQDKAAAYKKLLDYDLLILDDFASERKSDYMFEVLYNIINDRYNAKKPIVFTSNMTTEVFTSNMTTEETGNPTDPRIRRIMSRIWERGYPVEMTGQDRRKANTAWK